MKQVALSSESEGLQAGAKRSPHAGVWLFEKTSDRARYSHRVAELRAGHGSVAVPGLNGIQQVQSGKTAVTSISTRAHASISPHTSTQVMAGKFFPITSR